MSKEKVLKGVCHYHLETGSGGGHWAFQDSRFIQKNVPRGYCKKCGRGMIVIQESLNERKPLKCENGEHEEEIGDLWLYEGSNYISDGDFLTIFSPEDLTKIIWQGTISLIRNTSEPLTHTDQEGVEREEWTQYFLESYPAELIKARKS